MVAAQDEPDPELGRLPRIVEIKRTLAGGEKRFDCGVLRADGSHMVVLFVAPAAMHVHGVDLAAGTVTFGHFWTDRPYNVYHWLDADSGATIGRYVNLADETRIEPGTLSWRDLVVDILIGRDGAVTVLDEDEIPDDLPVDLRQSIESAKADVIGAAAALIAELEAYRRVLWPRVAPPAVSGR